MRYLPHTSKDRRMMLQVIGVKAVDELFVDVPRSAVLEGPVDLPRHAGEMAVERALSEMAAQNMAAGTVPFFVGAGAQ